VVTAQEASPVATPVTAGVEVVASGLTNPRGFSWGDDGTLYLALAGTGGEDQLVAEATPLPFFVGDTASIVTVADGCTSPVAEHLPSLFWVDAGWIWGVMDIAFLNGDLYALGGGGSTPEAPNGIYRVSMDGSWELVADLGTWASENPTEFIPPDYDPAGSWFDLEAGEDRLWVSEAVGGRLVTVTPDGAITLVADLSEGHLVPTGIALDGEGGAYVGHETTIPYPDGGSKVIHVAADGTVTDAWTGLTAVTDIALGPDGTLYAAEMATTNLEEAPFLNPNSGRIVRQTGPDSLEEVATGIPYPVYLGFDGSGALYVDYPAFGLDSKGEELGTLVRIDLSGSLPVSLAGMETPAPSCPDTGGVASPIASPVG
jgi:hypothetical protein